MHGAIGPRRRLLVLALALAAIPLGLLLYGLGSGGSFYFKSARAPLTPADAAPYYRESLLPLLLANLLGLTTAITSFRIYILAFWWLALPTVLTHAARRLPPTSILLVWLVLLTHPAAMIVHAWTCHPDALLLFLSALLLFTRRPASTALLAALAAWTNLPMAIVLVITILILARSFSEPDLRRRAIALAAGLTLGALGCKLTLHLAGVHLARDRLAAALAHDLPTLLAHWTAPGWPVLYTLHFAHLFWLPALVLTLRPHHPRILPAFLATQLLALAAAFLAEDTTRIFALLAWPSTIYCLIHALPHTQGHDRHHLRKLVLLATLITLIAPKFFAWKGDLHTLGGAHAHLRGLLP